MSATSAGGPGTAMPPGIAAFRQALRYALTAAEPVTPELLPRPTPCRSWDLRMLLVHATDSLAALTEGLVGHRIGLEPAVEPADGPADPGLAFRQRAWGLLVAGGHADPPGAVVTIGGCPMATELLVTAGALEIAMHGWDIAQTCGSRTPIPAPLAAGLLQAAPLLISGADRRELFAAPVAVADDASPSDRLAAYLGRSAS